MKFVISCCLLLILMSTACNTCEWVSSNPYAHPQDEIWKIVYHTVAKRYDILKASEQNYELETEWRRQMSMQYLESYRQKAHIKIVPYESIDDPKDISKPIDLKQPDNRPRYVVKVCVLREQNRDIDNPNIASQANWYASGNDSDEAGLLMTFIASRLALKMPISEPPPIPDKPTPDIENEDEEEEEDPLGIDPVVPPDSWNWELPKHDDTQSENFYSE